MRKIRAIPAKVSLPSWQEAVDEFILAARVAGKAETTVKDYQYYLPRFFTSCPDAWPDYRISTSPNVLLLFILHRPKCAGLFAD